MIVDTTTQKFLESCTVKYGYTVLPECEHGVFSAIVDKRGIPIVYSSDKDFLETILELANLGVNVPILENQLEVATSIEKEMQSEINALRASVKDMGDWKEKYEASEERWKIIDRLSLIHI